jgi:hypothetical protein
VGIAGVGNAGIGPAAFFGLRPGETLPDFAKRRFGVDRPGPLSLPECEDGELGDGKISEAVFVLRGAFFARDAVGFVMPSAGVELAVDEPLGALSNQF